MANFELPPSTMKALHIQSHVSSLSNLHPVDVPTPTPTPKRPILVRITHASITHVDCLYARGLHQNNRRHVKPPFTLGTEFAGVIEQLHPSATTTATNTTLKPGDRVFGSALGSYAQYITVSEKETRRVPERWSNRAACAVGASGAISLGAFQVGRLQKGETVLVLGAAGGLGVTACQIAQALEARVIAVVGSESKADVVRRLGVKEVVRYDMHHNWEDTVLRLTGGVGVDLVYDSIGAVGKGLKCLAWRGRIVVVGFAARKGVMEDVKINRILLKSATVVGYRFGEHGRRCPRETERIWNDLMALVERGTIQPVVYEDEGRYLGLASLSTAMQEVESGKCWGRAVVTIEHESGEAVIREKPML